MSSLKRNLVALAAVGLWSTNAWAAGLALDAMSVGWLLLVQYAVAAGVLLTVRRMRRRGKDTAASSGVSVQARGVGIVGLTGTTFLQYLAFATAPIVAANVLAYAWPLLAALAVAVTARSRQAVALAGLALIGFAGVGLIFASPRSADASQAGSATTWGYVAGLGSAACMTTYTLASSRIRVPATDLLIPATLTGAAAAAVLTAVAGSDWPQPAGWLAAAYIGLGPMATGYGLWTLAMSDGGAERLAPIGYATPLLSTVLLLATGAPATVAILIGISLVLVCSLGVLVYPTA